MTHLNTACLQGTIDAIVVIQEQVVCRRGEVVQDNGANEMMQGRLGISMPQKDVLG